MAFTYSSPSDSPKDAVRFLVGDIDDNDILLQDEDINFLLEEEDNVYYAAAEAAERIAAKFAREIDATAEGQNYRGSQLFSHYKELAERLRYLARRQNAKGAEPYAGGLSHHEREMDDADPDLVRSAFRSHKHDYPGSGQGGESTYEDPLKR